MSNLSLQLAKPPTRAKKKFVEELKWNRRIVRMLNFFISLEVPMSRPSFASLRTTLIVAKIRFYAFVVLASKFTLLNILESCEYARIRHYLGDWFVLYPESRRPAQLRAFLIVALVHLATKRSVFFCKSFDSSLFDYLIESPPCGRRKELAPSASVLVEMPGFHGDRENKLALTLTSPYRLRSSSTSGGQSSSSSSSWDLKPIWRSSYVSSGASSRAHNSQLSWPTDKTEKNFSDERVKGSAINRDTELWLRVGLKMRRAFTISTVFYSILLGIPMLSATARMALLKNTRQCEEEPVLIRLLGVIEIAYIMTETLSTAISIQTLLLCACEDIEQQLAILRANFSKWISLADRRCLFTLKSEQSFLQNQSPDHQNWKGSLNSYKYSNDPMKSSLRPDNPVLISNFEDDFELLKISANKLRDIQDRTVGTLTCLEHHKRLLAFLGDSAYSWFLTCLTFVPLLATTKATTNENKIAIAIYILIVAASGACYFIFAIISANLNYKVTSMAKLIFQLCARYQDTKATIIWNKIIYIWFRPPRCAVRVLNMLDLTYVNIITSLSYLLSGITLVLNYLDDN